MNSLSQFLRRHDILCSDKPAKSTLIVVCALLTFAGANVGLGAEKVDEYYQYHSGETVIPAASPNESLLPTVSVAKGLDYLEQSAHAWAQSKKCVSCHTTGSYMLIRPQLSKYAGPASDSMRQFFVEQLRDQEEMPDDKLLAGLTPARIACLAAGLVEWDRSVGGELSSESRDALKLMFRAQADQGAWGNNKSWPPFESSDFQATTVAVMAAAGASAWLNACGNKTCRDQMAKAKSYLVSTPPPHDYARLLLLWTDTRVPDLLDEEDRNQIMEMVWQHQREDGGWSIRSFAKPDERGNGNRAEKLRSEPEFQTPTSDGHQTGLAVLVLRDARVPASDPRLQKAVEWLKTHQRESGRWWTRSLNNDKWHFITYSGTGYALLALAKCDALPALDTAE